MLTNAGMQTLTRGEIQDLERLESVIQSSLNEMEAMGKALLEIRDKRLYRGEFKTFELYLRERWGKGRTWAHQLCEAAQVLENVRHGEQTETLPTNERQTRELAKLEPEEQVRVWTEAVKTGNTSAKGITETVELLIPESVKNKHVAEQLEEHGVMVECPYCETMYSGSHKCAKEPKDGDSPGLWNLKHRWKKANNAERCDFLEWVEKSGFKRKPVKSK